MTYLNGPQLLLRAPEINDVSLIYTWENNSEIWPVSNTLAPFSALSIEQLINESATDIFQTRQLRLMIMLHSGETIGCIDLYDFDPIHHRAGVGILIAEQQHRGKGYALESLTMLHSYCFEILQLRQLYACIDSNNLGSIRLFTKAGYTHTGTRDQWNRRGAQYVDEWFFQCFAPISTN